MAKNVSPKVLFEGFDSCSINDIRVSLEYIGEGLQGDYDKNDPDDEPLLRFYVEHKNDDGTWEEVEDASYCTNISANSSHDVIKKAVEFICKAYYDVLSNDPYVSVKKLGENLSWLSEEDFQKNTKQKNSVSSR